MGPVSCGKLAGAVSAALTSLTIAQNDIGERGGTALVEALKSAASIEIINIGQPLPLKSQYESDCLDLSKKQMDAGQAIILAWWLSLPVSAALTKLNVSQNIIGDEAMQALQRVAPSSVQLIH